jgi:hypothetical protein
MTTKAAELISAYGDISNAPGRRCQAQTIETIASETSAGITGATTVAEAHEAIAAIAIADRAVTSNSIGRATSVSAAQGFILTLSTLVGGSNYITGSYTAVPLTGGTGTGATANITVNNTGGIAALDTLVGGTLYDDGTYTSVSLTGGAGTGAEADIVVASGIVTSVTLTDPGTNYDDNDVLSAADADLGNLGTGSGFTISVDGTKGAVSVVTISAGGSGYDVGEVLSAANTNLGGAGSGFSITVATTTGPINA